MRPILLLSVLLVTLASKPAHAQGCDDPRAAGEMARIRREIGAPDVMCVEFARGDVDGDGRADAVLDIGYEVTGMEDGRRSALYVLFGDPAAPLAPEPEEPRGAVQAVRIEGPLIHVETLAHRPDDPPCCPSLIGDLLLRVEGHAVLRVLGP